MMNLLRNAARTAAALAATFAVAACGAQPAPGIAATPPPVLETVQSANKPLQSANDDGLRPALWKVSDSDTTIWLFGTIHALPPGLTWFDGRVAEAFASSQELVTEIAGEDPAKMQGLVMQLATLPKGKSLRAMLPANDKAPYEAALTTLGMPAATFDPFEPWYAAVGLSTLPLLKGGYDRDAGVEQRLDAEAKARSLPHTGLETSEFQLGLFDALPIDVQTRYLSEVIRNMPTIKDDLDKMVVAWRHGDADGLAQLMNAQEDDPALTEALLTSRNRNWAGWIGKRLEKPGTVFLAVGAGHLAGPGSVQEQLAKHGIAANRIQ